MFIDETREHLHAWSTGMLEIEKTNDVSSIPIIFRAAHTIKGMAMTMGFTSMGEITHHAENLLDGIRNDKLKLNSSIMDALFHALDALETLLTEIEEIGEEQSKNWQAVLSELDTVNHVDDRTAQPSSNHDAFIDASNSVVRTIAQATIEQGYRVYEIEIGFSKQCLMPIARWTQVRQVLDDNMILHTDPEPNVLEEGDYSGNIKFVYSSLQDVELVIDSLLKVSEIEIRSIGEWQKQGNTSVKTEHVLSKETFEIDLHVETVIQEALRKGCNVYEIGVRLSDQTQMKVARLFMVFESFGGQDHIIFIDPLMEDLEKEAFDRDIQMIIWSNDSIEIILKSIESISEIELVELREWNKQENKSNETSTKEQSKVEKKHQNKNETKKVSTIRVDTEKLDELMNLFSELVIDKTRLEQIRTEVSHNGLTQTTEHMSRVSNQLQELIMSIRMVPVESVFQRFPRMVRDTAKQVGKEIEFTISGENTELDRIVVEEIGDPIMHMLRNSIDHGIESTEVRVKNGKPSAGHIHLLAYPSGNYVFIEVEDDGGGINREKVLQKAIEKGIVQSGENLTDQQVYQLLFASGFSTADAISDLSGRGVGLDVVRAKIEALSGKVDIQSQPGKGTKFIIRLPLSLAILNGLLVKVNGDPYLIPIGTIAEVTEIPMLKSVNGQDVTVWRDQVVPVVHVGEVFEGTKNLQGKLILIHKGQQKAGLIVDELIGQQEVVLKSLDRELAKIPYFSGATILGDGTVALIIDTNAYFQEERNYA